MQKVMPFFNKYLPLATAVKGLSKLDTKYAKFFSEAAAFGYPAQEALDFLKKRLMGSSEQEERDLESREGSLRPDERAALSRMKSSSMPLEVGKDIAGLATKVGGAGLAVSSLSGLLNKGQSLEKQPTQSNIMEAPQEGWNQPRSGLSPMDVMSGQAVRQDQEISPQTQTIDPFEKIAQYSPAMADYLAQGVQKQLPIEGLVAQLYSKPEFKKAIKQFQENEGVNFLDWLLSQFGKKAEPGKGNAPPIKMGTQNVANVQSNDFQGELGSLNQVMSQILSRLPKQ